jgi:hypothetical protein
MNPHTDPLSWSILMSTVNPATTVLSVVQTTPSGDRPNNPGIIQEAQRLGVLDAADPTKLGAAVLANPQGVTLNFAHAIFAAIAFTKEREAQDATQPKPVTSEQDLWQYIERMIAKCNAAGLSFTITLDENGKMVPAIQKAAPTA